MPNLDVLKDIKDESLPAKGLESALDGAPENIQDREKWQILTHELV